MWPHLCHGKTWWHTLWLFSLFCPLKKGLVKQKKKTQQNRVAESSVLKAIQALYWACVAKAWSQGMSRHGSDPVPFRKLASYIWCSPRIAMRSLPQNGIAAICLIYQLKSRGLSCPCRDLTRIWLRSSYQPAVCQERVWLGLAAWSTRGNERLKAKHRVVQYCLSKAVRWESLSKRQKNRRFGDGEWRMTPSLNPSSLWFCCSHGASEQDKVGTAAEASVGVKSELLESGCPYATEQI